MPSSKLSFLLPALSLSISAAGQTTWWGMTANGGTADIGTIYTITESSTYTKRHDLQRNEGGGPKCDLVKASDGKYWGVTEFGGVNGTGTIFNYDPATGIYTTVVELNSATQGAQPIGGLLVAANGRLYGMCSSGGTFNSGTLYEFIISTSTFTKRFDFNPCNGCAAASKTGTMPRGRLVQLASGLMVGVTQSGGANNRGVVFTVSSTGTSDVAAFDASSRAATNGAAFPTRPTSSGVAASTDSNSRTRSSRPRRARARSSTASRTSGSTGFCRKS